MRVASLVGIRFSLCVHLQSLLCVCVCVCESIERIIMRDVLSYIDLVSVFVELLFIIIFANEQQHIA